LQQCSALTAEARILLGEITQATSGKAPVARARARASKKLPFYLWRDLPSSGEYFLDGIQTVAMVDQWG
jgi:hypothetical protein